jgi:polyisoprenoid-binding protein YceI
VLAVGAALTAQAVRTEFISDDPVGRNLVRVESRAPLETIETRTGFVTGTAKVNPDNLLDDPQAHFTVDLNTLDTGIALRNEHLRSEGWLNTAKYPSAEFTLTRIVSPTQPTPLPDGKTVPVQAEGQLTLHGVTKTIPVAAELTWIKGTQDTARRLPGDLLHIRATFAVELADYGITGQLGPMSLGKVAGTQHVTVDVFTSTEKPQIPEGMLQQLQRARREAAEGS